jgi:hypothetical protein
VRDDPDVAYVAADAEGTVSGTESNAPWGLDRIDQASATLDNTYNYNTDGAGVKVFVVDGGIRATHQEFGGRVAAGVDFVRDGHGTDDCSGHGTNVASIIGGSTYGVAKAVTLVPVRITGCGGIGALSGFVAAVDWVTANHTGTALANMSAGAFGIFQPLDDAMERSVNSGVLWTLSAGNFNDDACNYSPARALGAFTVGATTRTDARNTSSFPSNYGGCLHLFAPGVDIPGAGIASDTATSLFTGTSQAAPHVAGVAALYLQNRPNVPYWVLARNLRAVALPGLVTDAGPGSPNLLLSSRLPFGSSVALSRNNDSTLQMIGATTGGGLMWTNQLSISATTWTEPVGSSLPDDFALASSAGGTTSDNWNIQFLITIFGGIRYHIQGINSPFWQRMDGTVSSLAVVNQSNNQLRLFATDIQGRVWTRQQAGTGRTAAWGPWEQFGTRELSQITVERNVFGQLEVFGTDTAGRIFHSFQSGLPGVFGPWIQLPGSLVNVSLARGSDGLLIAVGTDNLGRIFQSKQISFGSWGSWVQIDGGLTQVTVKQRGDGRIELFGVNGSDMVWHRWQLDSSGRWSNWVLLGGALRG